MNDYIFECGWLRDVWRFIKYLDEQKAVLLGVEIEAPTMMRGKFVVRYQHSEELGIEVWT